MTNENFYIFVNRSFPWMLGRFFENRFNPLSMRKTFLHCFGGFVFIVTFTLTGVLYSQTPSKLDQASKNKNEFSKYNQRELPSNDQLPSTRRGLHSTPNNPVKEFGGFLDCTKSSLLYYYNCFNLSLVGMKSREGMSNREIYKKT